MHKGNILFLVIIFSAGLAFSVYPQQETQNFHHRARRGRGEVGPAKYAKETSDTDLHGINTDIFKPQRTQSLVDW